MALLDPSSGDKALVRTLTLRAARDVAILGAAADVGRIVYTPKEAAQMLGVSLTMVYEALRCKELPGRKLRGASRPGVRARPAIRAVGVAPPAR